MKDLTNILEAILFAIGRSVGINELKETLGVNAVEVENAIKELEKRYANNSMKRWDGTTIYNKNGNEIQIGTEALNIVFELVRNNFVETSEENFLSNLDNVKSVKEFLGIYYQRRNCCAHRGECYYTDKEICVEAKNSMKLCKDSNIIYKEEPIFLQDRILRKLEEISFHIVLNELNSKAGSLKKQINNVYNLLK